MISSAVCFSSACLFPYFVQNPNVDLEPISGGRSKTLTVLWAKGIINKVVYGTAYGSIIQSVYIDTDALGRDPPSRSCLRGVALGDHDTPASLLQTRHKHRLFHLQGNPALRISKKPKSRREQTPAGADSITIPLGCT